MPHDKSKFTWMLVKSLPTITSKSSYQLTNSIMNDEQKQNIKTHLDAIDIALETIHGALSDININRQYIFEELSFEQEEMYEFDPAQIEDAKEKMVDNEIKNLRESPRDHSDEYNFGSQIKEALIEDED